VLSAMVRPPGAAPASSAVLAAAREHGADAAVRACADALATCGAAGGAACRGRGACVDGRKHVVVTLGAGGVLWLSAPPQASHALADLLLVLPFFRAAALPALHFDFRHVPAPKPAQRAAAAAAGAGGALAGAMAASLARGGDGGGGLAMPTALRAGLAAARIAVEADAARRLTWPAVLRGLADVEPIDDAYEEVEAGVPA